jgi:hypothetical protein
VFIVLEKQQFDFTRHVDAITQCPSKDTLKLFKERFDDDLESRENWKPIRDALRHCLGC